MKIYFLFILFNVIAGLLSAQAEQPMLNTEQRPGLSMSDVEGITVKGQYRYFEKGATKPFSGILYARYSNGQYQSRQEFVDGIGEGTWINYYENGQLKEVGTYRQNRVEGPIKKYDESGRLRAEGTYKDWRIRVGKWTFYYPDGTVEKVQDYGTAGDFREVEDYYRRGEISKRWYQQIVAQRQ